MNSRHNNLTFYKETEIDGYQSFLDVKIFREDGTFVTTVYRKPISVVFIPILPTLCLRHINMDQFSHCCLAHLLQHQT